MYCIYLKEDNKTTSVHIEGNLNSVDKLTEIIADAILLNQKRNLQNVPIILDLSKTEAISEDCMEKLPGIISNYNNKIKFLNYSLYLEMQLRIHKLICNYSESEQE